MKNVIILCLLFIGAQVVASKITLDYEPSGVIVQFNLDSCTVYTDTTALLLALREDSTFKSRLKNLIKRKLIDDGNDTVVFNGWRIEFNDGLPGMPATPKRFNAEALVAYLTNKNGVKIYDKSERLVNVIKTKRVKRKTGRRSDYSIGIVYIDKSTKTELFVKGIRARRT